jgi:hypothetical protein
MGCDIHCFAEVKQKDRWVMVQDYFTPDSYSKEYLHKDKVTNCFDWRSYFMFGLLAGVRRNDVEPISEPKGLPLDISDEVNDEYLGWEDNVHSMSYLTLEELNNFDYSKYSDEYLSNLFFTHLYELNELKETYSDVRIVFWFDN